MYSLDFIFFDLNQDCKALLPTSIISSVTHLVPTV